MVLVAADGLLPPTENTDDPSGVASVLRVCSVWEQNRCCLHFVCLSGGLLLHLWTDFHGSWVIGHGLQIPSSHSGTCTRPKSIATEKL